MRIRLSLLVLALLWPAAVSAQQVCTTNSPTAFTCYAALPFKVSFDASAPVSGDAYRVHVSGQPSIPDVPAVAGATAVLLTLTGFPVGSYSISVGHVRPPLVEVLSTPVSLTLIPVPPQPPSAPGNLRIIAELLDSDGKVLARYLLQDVAPSPVQ